MGLSNMKTVYKSLRFTLVELMVVLSIIMLLMSLLVPAMDRVHRLTLEMQCANNLKISGTGNFNYLGDNNQLFWYDTGAESKTPNPYAGWGYSRWIYYIDHNYTGYNFGAKADNKVMNYGSTYHDFPDTSYFCHDNPNITTGELNSNRATTTYANNITLLRKRSKDYYYQGSIARVGQPDYITMLAEVAIKKDRAMDPYSVYFKYNLNAPHDERSNALFVDGHVSSIDGPVEGSSSDPDMIGKLGY